MKNDSHLTKAVEDYLEAIYLLEIKNGNDSIKSVDVANLLKVSKPAVAKATDELLQKGYIEKDPYGKIKLTSKGTEIGKSVYGVHLTLKEYLMKELGVSESTAEEDCCKIEHIISNETLKAIRNKLKK